MNKASLKVKYPFLEVSLPDRKEKFLLQTDNPQWLVQIIIFENKKQYDSFIKQQCIGTYTIDEVHRIAAMTVSPLQTVDINSKNMKEQNGLQVEVEKEALAWWINKMKEEVARTHETDQLSNNDSLPKLATDLRIGNIVDKIKPGSILTGIYDEMTNKLPNLESGKAIIELHTHGIRISVSTGKFDIHNSQIVSIEKKTSAEIIQSTKFAYGKASLGGLIAGPIGIFLGGISGNSIRNDVNVNTFLIINYIDPVMLDEDSIIIFCDNNQPIKQFIKYREQEIYKNITQRRLPQKERISTSMIIAIVSFILLIITFSITFIMLFNS